MSPDPALLTRLRSIRLIASDLDGTLLHPKAKLDDSTAAAIAAALAADLQVIANTGRQLTHLPDEIPASGIQYAIVSNGAICADLHTGDILFEELLEAATVAAVLDYFAEHVPGACFSAVRDHGHHHDVEAGYLDLLEPGDRPYWQHLQTVPRADLATQPTLKLTVRHPSMSADDLLAVIEQSGLNGFHATTSGAPFLEIAGAGVTKATGLARFCEHFDFEPAVVMALGDAKNDVEVLRWAGVGIAMGNAVPEAKAVADWVTADNLHDGAAQAIQAARAATEPDLGPELTQWATAAASRALAPFADLAADPRVKAALFAAQSWADGSGTAAQSQDAAVEAQLAARDLNEQGYTARASAVQAAALAAASAGDPQLAQQAAATALEALALNSAPCELDHNTGAERRQQWETLPAPVQLVSPEPPTPAAAACAVEPND